MASLTPLSKGLIALAVIGGMASAVWHLGLKERLSGNSATQQQQVPVSTTTTAPAQSAPPAGAAPTPPATPPTATNTAQVSKLSAAENAETGRKLLDSGDFAQARIHLEKAVQDGDAAAACLLGEMTLKGQGGIPANQDKAASLFQLAQSRNTICFSAAK
jgi:TPR repeat protein